MKETDQHCSNHPNPPIKGCDLLVLSLEREGVETVFAYPGGASLDLHQAMARRGTLRVVLPRHEQGGIFAADGYARATGKVGVCMATSGPGATNLVTGVANAFADSIPLVVITGQVNMMLIGRNAFQETDIFGVTLPICKYSFLITDVKDIPRVVKEAFYIASTGRPGPVVVDIPKNIQQSLTQLPEDWSAPVNLRSYRPDRKATDEQLQKVLVLIEQSKEPLLYVGGGVISSNGSDELRKFVKLTQVPVTTTLMGVGSFPENDPLSLQMLGMHGTAYANWATKETDLLLAFGCRFDDRVTGNVKAFAPNSKVVHIDIDSSELNKNKRADYPIEGNICDALARMNQMLEKSPLKADFSAWHKKISEWKKKAPLTWNAGSKVAKSKHIRFFHQDKHEEVIMPQEVIHHLNQMVPEDTIIVTGVGQHQMWTAQFYQFKKPRTFLTSAGLGSMGYGYPAALGAKIGCPDKQVVNIDGDGSFQMNIQELATAKMEKIAAKQIILNNQYLGMVAQWEDLFYQGLHANTFIGDFSGKEVLYPDFVKIAEGYSIKAERVVFKRDLKDALQRMLDSEEPYVLDIVVPNTAHVLPFIRAIGTVDDMVLDTRE
ncbi:MAG: biosynthetic-type acetolactate synthase large subunit [Verrucomicrobia bacterium]|nr:biosynthetic-type acetolactate synthase large subunit [Verrucomicrobiota bacterium]